VSSKICSFVYIYTIFIGYSSCSKAICSQILKIGSKKVVIHTIRTKYSAKWKKKKNKGTVKLLGHK
jgi:hypothetical protein